MNSKIKRLSTPQNEETMLISRLFVFRISYFMSTVLREPTPSFPIDRYPRSVVWAQGCQFTQLHVDILHGFKCRKRLIFQHNPAATFTPCIDSILRQEFEFQRPKKKKKKEKKNRGIRWTFHDSTPTGQPILNIRTGYHLIYLN